jgi:hypothetical protein
VYLFIQAVLSGEPRKEIFLGIMNITFNRIFQAIFWKKFKDKISYGGRNNLFQAQSNR